MMRAIHIISVISLVGTITGLRFVVIPAATTLGGDTEPQMLGAAMIRVRRIVWVSLVLAYLTGVLGFPFEDLASNTWLMLKAVLSGVFLIAALLLVVSPRRRLWLKTLEHRTLLLNILLALALAIILISGFLAYQSPRI